MQSVTEQPYGNQAMTPPDLGRWQGGPLPEPFEREALALFAKAHDMATWPDVSSAMRRAYRARIVETHLSERMTDDDQQMLAVSREWELPREAGEIDGRWLDAFLSTRLADLIARRHFKLPLLQLRPVDRGAVKVYAEQCISDAGITFGGTRAGDWQYEPEQDEVI